MVAQLFYDSLDFSNPIKYKFVTNILYNDLDVSKDTAVYLNWDINIVELKDSIWQLFGNAANYWFISPKSNDISTGSSYEVGMPTNYLITFYSESINYYTRDTLSILDIIGLAGGLFSILAVVGGLLVQFLTNKLYFYHLNSELNQVDITNFDFAKGSKKVWSKDLTKTTQQIYVNSPQRSPNPGQFSNIYNDINLKPSVTNIDSNTYTSSSARVQRVTLINSSKNNLGMKILRFHFSLMNFANRDKTKVQLHSRRHLI